MQLSSASTDIDARIREITESWKPEAIWTQSPAQKAYQDILFESYIGDVKEQYYSDIAKSMNELGVHLANDFYQKRYIETSGIIRETFEEVVMYLHESLPTGSADLTPVTLATAYVPDSEAFAAYLVCKEGVFTLLVNTEFFAKLRDISDAMIFAETVLGDIRYARDVALAALLGLWMLPDLQLHTLREREIDCIRRPVEKCPDDRLLYLAAYLRDPGARGRHGGDAGLIRSITAFGEHADRTFRQIMKYIIFHELGHYLLGHGSRSLSPRNRELEAETFAVVYLIRHYGDEDASGSLDAFYTMLNYGEALADRRVMTHISSIQRVAVAIAVRQHEGRRSESIIRRFAENREVARIHIAEYNGRGHYMRQWHSKSVFLDVSALGEHVNRLAVNQDGSQGVGDARIRDLVQEELEGRRRYEYWRRVDDRSVIYGEQKLWGSRTSNEYRQWLEEYDRRRRLRR